ncbi:hypothetical protein SAMN05518672_105329 [Chitinophaga sp. CF118]|uniref:hypothetical protein n=1 Tax=Chitinophaga sp. CF118 TaxID=1884367 RepID=UPI0008E55268|nr:hypothetical protein [Chitinophaga sp. CF118]SFE33946.1 hypothetical protein SAMN05518672_105329 [Chitinophaga sp. CF118]
MKLLHQLIATQKKIQPTVTAVEKITVPKALIQSRGIENWVKVANCTAQGAKLGNVLKTARVPNKALYNMSYWDKTRSLHHGGATKTLQRNINAAQAYYDQFSGYKTWDHYIEHLYPINSILGNIVTGYTGAFKTLTTANIAFAEPFARLLNYFFVCRPFRSPKGIEALSCELLEDGKNGRLKHQVAGDRRKYLTPAIFELLPEPLELSILTDPIHEEDWGLVRGEGQDGGTTLIETLTAQFWKIETAIEEQVEKLQKKIRRQIKWAYKQLQQLTTDVRSFIRTIIRSMRITPFDGKDSDSDFVTTNIGNGITFNHFKFIIKCQISRNSSNWLNTPSLN